MKEEMLEKSLEPNGFSILDLRFSIGRSAGLFKSKI